jgi:hypothetical protein
MLSPMTKDVDRNDRDLQSPAPAPFEVRQAAQAARARAQVVLAQSISVREESRELHEQIAARRQLSVG